MRVVCRHGHFAFYPRRASDLSRFSSYFNLNLGREEDYYTFKELVDAPHYSIIGKPYIHLPAISTYEGKPWDVMRENSFVYHLQTGLVIPKVSVLSMMDLPLVGNYYLAGGALIQPGALDLTGQRILSYTGEFVEEGFKLRVVEFSYE